MGTTVSTAVLGAVAVCAAGPLVLFVGAMVNRGQPDGVPLARWSARWWLEHTSLWAFQALSAIGVVMLWHLLGWKGVLAGVAVVAAALAAALGAAAVMGHRRRRREAAR